MTEENYIVWRKSSRSDGDGNCVEVAESESLRTIAVRDSKDCGGPMLQFSRSGWRDFLDGVRAGEFDLR